MDGCVYRSQFDFCEKNKEEDEKLGIRRWCDFEGCNDKHPSNTDRIRSMTNKELAKFFESIVNQTIGSFFHLNPKEIYEESDWIWWLEQEVKGE